MTSSPPVFSASPAAFPALQAELARVQARPATREAALRAEGLIRG